MSGVKVTLNGQVLTLTVSALVSVPRTPAIYTALSTDRQRRTLNGLDDGILTTVQRGGSRGGLQGRQAFCCPQHGTRGTVTAHQNTDNIADTTETIKHIPILPPSQLLTAQPANALTCALT